MEGQGQPESVTVSRWESDFRVILVVLGHF